MKIKVKELRKLIGEEFMRGVPEFVVREATRSYVNEIRKHIHKHILAKAKTPEDSRYAINEANKVLVELEEEANDLLEAKLWQWLQRI